ncbi:MULTISPECIES: recombinase family protein [unclassified Marinobacter]|uniref:recombinase family protein n=1 Tax=unclassified Marinobacter TaxID=83889 RepID=UPI001928BF47|nr:MULTISPECIES: recombinase family protein [unclassified Marinobacter]MBL3826559.1 recombinase family protein [Marinobacter sp. MC3]MBL3894924.1 recombinase family protein [Marinobacter sp. MW3]
MTVFAYCRVSTNEQDTSAQREAVLKRYPSAVVREEKASGTSRSGRPVLELLLEVLTDGDVLVVWKLDRLARNLLDLQNIVADVERKGASLEIIDQQINTSSASGKAFLQMLGVFAEFENNLRRERQMSGIAKAKIEGKFRGSEKRIDRERVSALLQSHIPPSEVARQLKISRQSVYRIMKEVVTTQ